MAFLEKDAPVKNAEQYAEAFDRDHVGGFGHGNGKGMEKAGANPRLTQMINMCIRGPLKGEPLNEETVAMESLRMYLKSLAK